jgi:tripartite-type tricarboxylate transporter receptor subunit TctC
MTHDISRLRRAALLAPLAAMAGHVLAQATQDTAPFPNRPVRIIVPVAAGGSSDKLTRLVAERLSVLWGQSVLVENVAGASGIIGSTRVAKAAPDGYTLLQQGEGLTLNAIMHKELPYDPQRAFTPVIKAVVNPQVLVVHPATGMHSFAEYLARAKAQPESISLALPGAGGIAHLAHEIISQETGARVNYIPYQGGGPAALDVLGGHANATLITLAAVTEYVRAGRLRALAVTTSYRSPALPEVPTMGEAGLPGFALESWQGYLAPAGTPAPVLEKINRDFQAVLRQPEVRARLEDLGFKVAAGPAAELGATLQREHARYSQVVRSSRIALK